MKKLIALILLTLTDVGYTFAISLEELLRRIDENGYLNLNTQGLTLQDVDIVASLLAKNHTRITGLDLSNNQIGIEEAKLIAAALLTNTTLSAICLRNTQIGDGEARLVAAALKENTTLISLNLENNRIGKKGAEYIIAALIVNETLQMLDLNGNPIDERRENLIKTLLTFRKNILWRDAIQAKMTLVTPKRRMNTTNSDRKVSKKPKTSEGDTPPKKFDLSQNHAVGRAKVVQKSSKFDTTIKQLGGQVEKLLEDTSTTRIPSRKVLEASNEEELQVFSDLNTDSLVPSSVESSDFDLSKRYKEEDSDLTPVPRLPIKEEEGSYINFFEAYDEEKLDSDFESLFPNSTENPDFEYLKRCRKEGLSWELASRLPLEGEGFPLFPNDDEEFVEDSKFLHDKIDFPKRSEVGSYFLLPRCDGSKCPLLDRSPERKRPRQTTEVD